MSFVYEGRREPLFAGPQGRPLEAQLGTAVQRFFGWCRREALRRVPDATALRALAARGLAVSD